MGGREVPAGTASALYQNNNVCHFFPHVPSLFGLVEVIPGPKILLVTISSSNWCVLFSLFTQVLNQELSDVQQRGNVPERAASLIRFREKRKERNYEKKVRYNVRKQVALRYEIHDSLYIPLALLLCPGVCHMDLIKAKGSK